MNVPFFRPSISEAEIAEVVGCLRSGWLTTGPTTKRFETAFAEAVGGKHAVAVNSCTAALHLAVEALGLKAGQAVLVPTMTFAATAEIVRYQGAVPILVDCDPVTTNLDLADAARKIEQLRSGKLPAAMPASLELVGIIPVHVGGVMLDVAKVREFARAHGLWTIDDAAHAFPAAWRPAADRPWQRCGEGTAAVSCYSFYANKTITTGEGGMAVTDDPALADRMRLMSLHGLSHDAWKRYSGGTSWDYRILAPGYKYNMTDIAAALGVRQLERAEAMRLERESLALRYRAELAEVGELALPRCRPIASIRGICSRFGSAWSDSRSTAISLSSLCASAASAARSIGDRCICIRTMRSNSAGSQSSSRLRRHFGSDPSRCRCFQGCATTSLSTSSKSFAPFAARIAARRARCACR